TLVVYAPGATSGKSGQSVVHAVQSGESLWSIAQRYGTSVEKIVRDNGLKDHRIFPGQKLNISP
ncbi:MAG: LysM peptidoglycan-binding domain-containing protein, partial [Bacteroidia bacterium]|nr:LysM peptidoglycan-binding domain-containing protein [Bacteroidia bacterium]